jgi:hypothetical protein
VDTKSLEVGIWNRWVFVLKNKMKWVVCGYWVSKASGDE